MRPKLLFLRPGLLPIVALCLAVDMAAADVYRWQDDKGVVHYTQKPPANRPSTRLDIKVEATPPRRPPASAECHTIQCQYERLRDDRLITDARDRADRAAAAERARATPRARGMTFEVYSLLGRGMIEAEVMQRAGPPDHESQDPWRSTKTWVYLPTLSDPFTTSVTLRDGRVFDLDRQRRL